MKVFDICY